MLDHTIYHPFYDILNGVLSLDTLYIPSSTKRERDAHVLHHCMHGAYHTTLPVDITTSCASCTSCSDHVHHGDNGGKQGYIHVIYLHDTTVLGQIWSFGVPKWSIFRTSHNDPFLAPPRIVGIMMIIIMHMLCIMVIHTTIRVGYHARCAHVPSYPHHGGNGQYRGIQGVQKGGHNPSFVFYARAYIYKGIVPHFQRPLFRPLFRPHLSPIYPYIQGEGIGS